MQKRNSAWTNLNQSNKLKEATVQAWKCIQKKKLLQARGVQLNKPYLLLLTFCSSCLPLSVPLVDLLALIL